MCKTVLDSDRCKTKTVLDSDRCKTVLRQW